MDYEQIGREFLLALRGRRSQVAWSRRLGYRSNVAYSWESGRRWPTAAETLRAARRSGIDVTDALSRFYGTPPPWLEARDPTTPEAVARLIHDLRGQRSITELAARAELSRYALSRWSSGHTQPRLPDFLRLVEAASLRLVDLLTAFVEPSRLPSVEPLWRRLEGRRRGAALHPWTQAVLRALELRDYLDLPGHQDGWIAERLGMSIEEERTCLAFLVETDQVTWSGSHWQPDRLAVETRRHADVGREVETHWTVVARDRIDRGGSGQFSYNVFTVSRADFERIRELHLAYFHALRAIAGAGAATPRSADLVAVANVQLFELGAFDER